MSEERLPHTSVLTGKAPMRWLWVALWVALSAVLVAAVFGYTAFTLPGEVNVRAHSSGIYDMDIDRVVIDLTSPLKGYRTSVHPLQKLLVAPIGMELNSLVYSGANRLGAAKLLVATFMALQALLVGVLTYQLTRGALPAALAAGLVSSLSFSSLLGASLPESAALSSVGSTIPLIWLAARAGRRFTRSEAVVWALIGVVCIGFTITQIVYWMIALAVRASAIGSSAVKKVVTSGALFLIATFGAVELQSNLFPDTPKFYLSNPVAGEQPFFRLGSIGAQPVYHTLRLLGHFTLFDFAAPFPGYADFLIRDYGFDYWSLSIERARIDQVTAPQWVLAVGLLLGVVAGCVALSRADRRFIAPGLCVASQFGLHFFYGREYILYSPNWHGVWVAMLVAACWNIWPTRRTAGLIAAGVLSVGMLANNVIVLREVYREVDAGLQMSVRDSHGVFEEGVLKEGALKENALKE